MAMTMKLVLSDKYKDFIKHTGTKVEILEGTTAAGKTTVGIFKFILLCAKSKKRYHVMAATTTGAAERNFIQKDLGVLDDFGDLVEYFGHGTQGLKLPHIILHTGEGDKIIYIVSYGDKSKWQMIRGSQFGCTYIDEINLADVDFLHEIFMRSDYTMATLNPDAPDKIVYSEYINHARPLAKYKQDVPQSILSALESETPKDGYLYWFFTFDDNKGLSSEKKAQIIANVPPGTKQYKNMIQGLRGRSTGLVFPNFDSTKVITESDAKAYKYKKFTCGVDTAYSRLSDDTIAFIFEGITEDGKLVILEENVVNNKDISKPISPSDTAKRLDDFLHYCFNKWGYSPGVFIDSADQGTIMEASKFLRNNPRAYQIAGAYKGVKIISRIEMQLGWLNNGDYLVNESCKNHIKELNVYTWAEGKDKPEDANDHTVNAAQYGWIPYRQMIGG